MRDLEMLLLAELVALVIMAFPRLRDAGWWRLPAIGPPHRVDRWRGSWRVRCQQAAGR